MLLVGPKRSGKGTIGHVIRGLVGSENVCAPTLGSLATNFGRQPLIGKTAAIVGDARLSGRSDAAQILEVLLSISGGDPQTIDKKYAEAVTALLPLRFTIMTNELPQFKDPSGAFVDRLLVLTMTRTWLGREDTTLKRRLLDELPGILLWAMRGWQRLRQNHRFIVAKSSERLTEQFRDLTNPVGAFLRECCRLGADESCPKTDLYRRYEAWCTSHGRNAPDDSYFAKDLRAAIPTLDAKQRRIAGRPIWHWLGISLRDPADDGDEAEGEPSQAEEVSQADGVQTAKAAAFDLATDLADPPEVREGEGRKPPVSQASSQADSKASLPDSLEEMPLSQVSQADSDICVAREKRRQEMAGLRGMRSATTPTMGGCL